MFTNSFKIVWHIIKIYTECLSVIYHKTKMCISKRQPLIALNNSISVHLHCVAFKINHHCNAQVKQTISYTMYDGRKTTVLIVSCNNPCCKVICASRGFKVLGLPSILLLHPCIFKGQVHITLQWKKTTCQNRRYKWSSSIYNVSWWVIVSWSLCNLHSVACVDSRT